MKIQRFILLALAVVCLLPASLAGQTRILPLGDSVTSSFAPNSSYRYWLWTILTRRGFDVDFVGTQWGVAGGSPGNTDFDQHHEGHPGWTTSDLLFSIESIAAATVPDIVLLDIGSNDVLEGIPASETRNNLVSIIDELRAVNPAVIVLLAQTTPYAGQSKRGMSMLKAAVKSACKIQKRSGGRVGIVNLAASFSVKRDTIDGVHPNVRGEQKIAVRYFNVLRKLIR
ncbi:MAG TPA: GDSL-type esterase/lipase family protein [Verrucomicrobiae bacterium]|nr:GDSL-type esterase/lipase family protein [Verrucomicrobiae bacterium]